MSESIISLKTVKSPIFSVLFKIPSVLSDAISPLSLSISFLKDFHSLKNLSQVLGSCSGVTLNTSELSFNILSLRCAASIAASPAENSILSTPS
jgi:hypothetical protein